MEKFIGVNFKVLYEQNFNGNDDLYEGYTPNYIKVVSKSESQIDEKILDTKIIEAKDEYSIGNIM
ncbi:hypothetical protein SDC9_179342 [bioreactor metagenome]|uniref:Uncharacterized protein n=2 Tax=root TaxID=1 RepID=A0A645GYN5_9ZZZZ